MTKKNIMPAVVLTAICVVVAALLGVVNMFTAPVIEEAEEQRKFDSYRVVLDGSFEEIDKPTNAPSTVTGLLKVTEDGALKGHVVTLVTKGYAGDISITVGVDADGKVTKAVITNQSETHGKAGMATYTDKFAGVNAETVADVETFSGATISSTAIKNAIIDAVNTVTGNVSEEPEEEKLPKTDEEIKSLATEMVDGTPTLEDITLEEAPETLKRAYSAGDDGYFIYIVVPGDYVPVATEAVVHLDTECKIVKVNLLQWVVGHDVGAGDFADGFAGADKDTVGEVELVTGATGTSEDFRTAVSEAVAYMASNTEEQLPTSDDGIKAIAAELAGKELTLEELPLTDAPETLKRAYSAGDDGYFAYIVVPGDYVPVATEAVVHLDTECKIVKVNLLQWVVGHDVGAGNFADGFVGADKDTVDDVELVTGATGTSEDFRNAVSEAVKYFVNNYKPTETLPTTDDEIKAIAAELAGKELTLEELPLTDAPETLKRAYSAGVDGYFLYIVVPGAYVPVATEAVVHLDTDFKIVKVELLQWVVGHDVGAGNFADGFTGVDKDTVGDVELVTGATGTSSDFRTALEAALIFVADGEATAENLFVKQLEAFLPTASGFESITVPSDAPASLKKLYKTCGIDGYVAYIVTSTQYVAVETESLVYINSKYEVADIKLLTWTVGHGTEPGDFPERLIGLSASELEDVELISGTTGTSEHLRDAVIGALKAVPKNYAPMIVGISVLSVALVAAVCAIIISKKRRSIKK